MNAHVYEARYMGVYRLGPLVDPFRLVFELDLGFFIQTTKVFHLEGVAFNVPHQDATLLDFYDEHLYQAEEIFLQSIQMKRADVTYRIGSKWYNLAKSLMDEGLVYASQ